MENKQSSQQPADGDFWNQLKFGDDPFSQQKDKPVPKVLKPVQSPPQKKNLPQNNPEQKTYNKSENGDNMKGQERYLHLQGLVDNEIKLKWKEEQYKLTQQLIEEDDFDWKVDDKNPVKSTLKLVAGLDISYSKYNSKKAVAALIICEFPSMRAIYEDFEIETTDYPYIPGFLAFKEVPGYLVLFDRLKKKRPDLWPQVLLLDGNGIFHTRSFGIACHLGVLVDIPSLGVSKTVFAVDGITQDGAKHLCDKYLSKQGDMFELIGKSKKVWAVAMKSSSNKMDEPIYISRGHRISTETSVKIVKCCLDKYRCPMPIHIADQKSRELVKKHYDGDKKKSYSKQNYHKGNNYRDDEYDDEQDI